MKFLPKKQRLANKKEISKIKTNYIPVSVNTYLKFKVQASLKGMGLKEYLDFIANNNCG